jgi:hypothetical protein
VNTLELIGIGNNFLTRIRMAQQLREKIDKWGYMKLKSFCIAKEFVTRLKRVFTKWKKVLSAIHLTRD